MNRVLTKRFAIFALLHAITGSNAVYFDIEMWVIGSIVALWIMFIPTGMLLTRHRKEPITGWKYVAGVIWGVIFIIVDVIVNYTAMTYVFLELPDNDRKTVTERLKHYIKTEPFSWRGKLAIYICAYLIEPWHFGHCALRRLGIIK